MQENASYVRSELTMIDETIEEMQRKSREIKKTHKADEILQVSKELNSRYQQVVLKIAELEEKVTSMESGLVQVKGNRMVWEKKIEGLRSEVKNSELNAKNVYKILDQNLKEKHQEAYLFGGDDYSNKHDHKDKTVSNLVEEKNLLNNSAKMANDSINAGIGMLHSFERQTNLMGVKNY